MSEHDDSWHKLLDPITLKSNLVRASLFVTAYETFRSNIQDCLISFFADTWDNGKPISGKAYQTEVRSKHRNQLVASLEWFRSMNAIDNGDMSSFYAIRAHRNEVVHEMFAFMADSNRDIDDELFEQLITIYQKIEKWWVINVEFAIDPDIDMDSVDIDSVVPGPILGLQLLLDISLGREPKEGYYKEMYAEAKHSETKTIPFLTRVGFWSL